jgi:hypothetical protein
MALYHRDIYMPKVVRHMHKQFDEVTISEHARKKAEERGIVTIPQELCVVSGPEIVEAEFDRGTLVKIVVRKRYNFTHDICYVLRYDFNTGIPVLITVWLNSVDDDHSTLDESVYEKE